MQSIIDDINPDELGLKSIDANGNVVDFNPNEMADMYYSPVNKYTGFVTDPDSWWNKDQRREKSEKAYSRYTAEIRGKDTGDISFKTIREDKPTQPSALEQLGKTFGITFGVKTDRRHQSLLDRRNVQKQTPEINKSTGFDLSKIDKGRTSGPSISKAADLPDFPQWNDIVQYPESPTESCDHQVVVASMDGEIRNRNSRQSMGPTRPARSLIKTYIQTKFCSSE